MAQLGFNADEYDPTDEFEPLPPGEYLTMITEASLDNTKSGGQMVKLTYTVMEGQFEGRKLWSQHNIVNNSPKKAEERDWQKRDQSYCPCRWTAQD